MILRVPRDSRPASFKECADLAIQSSIAMSTRPTNNLWALAV